MRGLHCSLEGIVGGTLWPPEVRGGPCRWKESAVLFNGEDFSPSVGGGWQTGKRVRAFTPKTRDLTLTSTGVKGAVGVERMEQTTRLTFCGRLRGLSPEKLHGHSGFACLTVQSPVLCVSLAPLPGENKALM